MQYAWAGKSHTHTPNTGCQLYLVVTLVSLTENADDDEVGFDDFQQSLHL